MLFTSCKIELILADSPCIKVSKFPEAPSKLRNVRSILPKLLLKFFFVSSLNNPWTINITESNDPSKRSAFCFNGNICWLTCSISPRSTWERRVSPLTAVTWESPGTRATTFEPIKSALWIMANVFDGSSNPLSTENFTSTRSNRSPVNWIEITCPTW